MDYLTELSRMEDFSTLEPVDLGIDATPFEAAGLDVWDFIDLSELA